VDAAHWSGVLEEIAMRTRTLARTLTLAALATTLLATPVLATEGTPSPAPQAPPATREFRNTCDPAKALLPDVVEGDPGVKAGAKEGLYVWHEKKGWRVRLTHDLPKVADKAQRIEVRGVITSSRPISNVRLVKLEEQQRGEWVSVKRPGRKALGFRFVNYGGIDGINFTAGCAGKLTFTAWMVTRDSATGKLVRDAAGNVVRTPLRVFVGRVPAGQATPTEVTDPAATANPRRVSPPDDATKVLILRTPVQPIPAVPAA
jgi:hypothetical protein